MKTTDELLNIIQGGLYGLFIADFLGYQFAGYSQYASDEQFSNDDAVNEYKNVLEILRGNKDIFYGMIGYDGLSLDGKLTFESLKLAVEYNDLQRGNNDELRLFGYDAMRRYTNIFLDHLESHNMELPENHYLYETGECYCFERYHKEKKITYNENCLTGEALLRAVPFAIIGREDLAQMQAKITNASVSVTSAIVRLCKITSEVIYSPFNPCSVIDGARPFEGGEPIDATATGELNLALECARRSGSYGAGIVSDLEAIRTGFYVIPLCGYLLGLKYGLDGVTAAYRASMSLELVTVIAGFADIVSDLLKD